VCEYIYAVGLPAESGPSVAAVQGSKRRGGRGEPGVYIDVYIYRPFIYIYIYIHIYIYICVCVCVCVYISGYSPEPVSEVRG